ncbi:MAG: AMP-binding protein [Reyranella sp.]|uniref:class I adenylate-forming enzyme family protein n=1 Tax=Reyranella sp. TaxID=1929291 RepID=UPI0025FFC31D|nr:AMP-binding protein [Reyranella sp.]MBR2813537.1 AMP-binding protein [Reyranella sp.]
MDVRTQMRNSARYNAQREAIVAGDRRLSFAEAWDRGVRMANGLLALGLEPQDRVGVLEDNTLESSDLFLGAAIANLVRVPLYPRNARESHAHMLGHTGCRAVVVAEKYAEEIQGLRGDLPAVEHVVVRDAGYEGWLARQSNVDPDPVIDPQHYFIIRHTGGTTGKSKGVAYTHQAWLAAGRDWFYLYPPVEPGDSCLHLAPISHGSGYLFTPIWLGGGRNVMAEKFDPASLLDLMETERTGYMFMVPTILNAINRIPGIEQRKFPHLKCMLVSSAPIADETALKAYEIFGDAMYQGYGQTEVLPVAMMGPRQWFAKDVPGSQPLRACGMPLPFAQLQIWDEENQPVPPGEAGEIVAKTEGQMQGFWNNPEATAERIVNGWVKTGDIGRLDANGYLYMLDRADDMVISGGFNIYPAELENIIAAHPGVLEVAVFGIPDPRWGETPCAVVCVKPDGAVTEKELVDLCSVHLGNYKRPGRIVIRHDPLPKTPVGKIKRKELREPFWAGHARRVAGN